MLFQELRTYKIDFFNHYFVLVVLDITIFTGDIKIYWYQHFTTCNLGFNHKIWLRNLLGKERPKFLLFLLLPFPSWCPRQHALDHFPSVWRASFSQSLTGGMLMETSSIVFHDLGMFLSPPSFLKNTLTRYPQLTGLFFKHLKYNLSLPSGLYGFR